MKRLAFAALVFFAADARAEVPAYSALPNGHATSPPKTKRPDWISPNERVPGFFLTQAPMHPRIPKGSRPLSVVGSARIAEEMKANGGADEGAPSGICFSQARANVGREDEDEDGERSFDWTEGLANQANVWPKSENNPTGGVTAVHAEKLIEDDAGARVESTDVWVDPATRGVRKVASATLPLRLVRTALGGLKVYAARDERKDRRLVQFVIVQPTRSDVPQTTTMVAMHQNGGASHSTSCSHLRVAIPIDPRGGDGATVTTTLVLPSRQEGEVRMREARIQLSVSQTTRDKEPLVSVSFGWAGRETTQRTPNVPDE